MMRVGILDGGMEVEHLKRGHDDSVSSIASTPSLSSAGSSSSDLHSLADDSDEARLRQTQLNSQGPTPKAPFGQPQAAVADRNTLSIPPSESFRIVQAVPDLRPGLLHRSHRLDCHTKVDVDDEIGVLVGAQ